jgi:dolichyl-phosphate beta-glucosyltransferase
VAESKPYLSLIIPAYNEAKRIVTTVSTVRAYLDSSRSWAGTSCPGPTLGYEIIVVNDGSTDTTAEILSGIANVEIVSYQPNRGKGHAVRQGMLASKGDYAAFTDVDMSAPIDELANLFTAIHAGADVAIASRAIGGSQLLVRQPAYRELGGRMLNLVIRLLAVPGIRDTQCGLKLFAGDLARRVFAKCVLNGWGFDVEALYLARELGGRIAEVPVRWSHDADTRIRPLRAGLQVIRDVLRIRLHNYEL